MFLEHRRHRAVAFSERVDVFDRDGERNGVVDDVGDVEVVVAPGYFHQGIAVVVIVVAIFDGDVVGRVHGPFKIIETTVTLESQHPFDMKIQVVDVAVVCHFKGHQKVGIADIAALHVREKFFTEAIAEVVLAFGKGFQRDFEFGEFSHWWVDELNRRKIGPGWVKR